MNINVLNEDNLWFIKNVPVAGAKLINSLGEGCPPPPSFSLFSPLLSSFCSFMSDPQRVSYLNQHLPIRIFWLTWKHIHINTHIFLFIHFQVSLGSSLWPADFGCQISNTKIGLKMFISQSQLISHILFFSQMSESSNKFDVFFSCSSSVGPCSKIIILRPWHVSDWLLLSSLKNVKIV